MQLVGRRGVRVQREPSDLVQLAGPVGELNHKDAASHSANLALTVGHQLMEDGHGGVRRDGDLIPLSNLLHAPQHLAENGAAKGGEELDQSFLLEVHEDVGHVLRCLDLLDVTRHTDRVARLVGPTIC